MAKLRFLFRPCVFSTSTPLNMSIHKDVWDFENGCGLLSLGLGDRGQFCFHTPLAGTKAYCVDPSRIAVQGKPGTRDWFNPDRDVLYADADAVNKLVVDGFKDMPPFHTHAGRLPTLGPAVKELAVDASIFCHDRYRLDYILARLFALFPRLASLQVIFPNDITGLLPTADMLARHKFSLVEPPSDELELPNNTQISLSTAKTRILNAVLDARERGYLSVV